MKTSPVEDTDSPPRILIVENERGTVSNLQHKLERDIPRVIIEAAYNVADGQKKLNESCSRDWDPDALILDFKLPKDGQNAEEIGNVSLAFVRNPDMLVIHVTAWPNDPLFKQMVDASKFSSMGLRLVFPKFDNWAQEVADACAKHIREKNARRIRAEYEDLFGGDVETARRARASGRRGSGPGDRSWGLKFAVFCSHAGDYWNELGEHDKELQDLLARTFGHMEDESGRHYVGVLTEDDSTDDASEKEAR